MGTVKAFQVSDANYPKALASLKRVYDNPCLIFFENISRLFDLPEVPKPSSSALRNMIDTVSAIYDSLLSLGDDKQITNTIIIHLVMSKIDPITRSKWEEQMDYDTLPLWKDCEAILNKRFQHISAEEASTSKSVKANKQRQDNSVKYNQKSSFSATKSQPQQKSRSKCLYCNSIDHFITACPTFVILPNKERFEFIKSISGCINCLRKGHSVSQCKLSNCRICNQSHHTLLHKYTSSMPNNSERPSNSHVMHASVNDDRVILATAVVKVKRKSGDFVLARALLDSGSQTNFVTEDMAQKLQIPKEESLLKLFGVGNANLMCKSRV